MKSRFAAPMTSLAAVCFLFVPTLNFAQQADNAQPTAVVAVTPPPPATLLENILARKNTVIVKGFTEIATVAGEDSAAIRIIAVELTSSANGDRALGLAIEVHSQGDRTSVSYIDADEIDSLISALDYLVKADASVTPLANYMIQYRTRGDMELSNFLADGSRMVGIKSDQFLPVTNQLVTATAYLRVATIPELKQQLIAAQQALNKIKK